MKKPVRPKKPHLKGRPKLTEPRRRVTRDKIDISVCVGKTLRDKIEDYKREQEAAFSREITLDDITVENNWDDTEIIVWVSHTVNNPTYDVDLRNYEWKKETYEKDLSRWQDREEKHKEKLVVYEKKLEKYFKDLDKWNKLQKEKNLKEKRKLLNELKEELGES